VKFAAGPQDTGGVPLKSWIVREELHASEALWEQTRNIAQSPWAYHHVALMPDAHVGYGMPIGGVLALDGALCPAAVGYDIGCGMLAFKTSIPAEALRGCIAEVQAAVREAVPSGLGVGREELSPYAHLRPEIADEDAVCVSAKVSAGVDVQLGTLGEGNHFIEFDSDEVGDLWVVIHSGSRGVGHPIADHYMKLAAKLNKMWKTATIPSLECLPFGTPEAARYKTALTWALEWAFANRLVMALHVQDVLREQFGTLEVTDEINVHHNDATCENHFGRNVWVHRKGATRAREGERLVIPGNMGQGTAICTGLGNPDSFCSSSHGAGRRLGRKQARRELKYAEEKAKLDALGVTLSAGRDGALDEMPAAYKDFHEVMDAQSDLVTVEHWLTPIGVIKG
jgi:tRNA-splicing ligase RtcB (3'-phosphate/5'-hydroxy nucleic acid ligase)